jgi:hypothetical protein
METKLSMLRRHMAVGDYKSALRLAANWQQLGAHRDAITKGWAAMQYPRFYSDIGEEPDAIVQAGVAAIRDRYGI